MVVIFDFASTPRSCFLAPDYTFLFSSLRRYLPPNSKVRIRVSRDVSSITFSVVKHNTCFEIFANKGLIFFFLLRVGIELVFIHCGQIIVSESLVI